MQEIHVKGGQEDFLDAERCLIELPRGSASRKHPADLKVPRFATWTKHCINTLTNHQKMVLLTITSSILAALQACRDRGLDYQITTDATEPPLGHPMIGAPISHSQILNTFRVLRKQEALKPSVSFHLNELLEGSRIYNEAPSSKAEPVRLVKMPTLLPY